MLYSRHSRWNATGYHNPHVEKLLKAIPQETISYARDAMTEEAWQIVLSDIVY